ncbi:MAG TPA: hypothetical protein PKJ45_09465 [Rubrivivax sp.]|nr:hypothetical protein [Rubrivivax sp.]
MSLTSNFDYCVQLGLVPVKTIFHLALKNEGLFPHNVGPFMRNFSGRMLTVQARLIDDETDPADLEFADAKHVRFFLPFELTVETPDAPDPTLTRVTLKATCTLPGALANWPVDGEDQLGVSFAGISEADVTVPAISGLPVLDAARLAAAIHTRYSALPTHRFTLGNNVLVIYDGNRDPTLDPANAATPYEIQTAIEPHGGKDYLKVTLPIHGTVPSAAFANYGRVVVWREIVPGDGTVSVTMGSMPADPTLATQVDFDGAHPAETLIVTSLKPLIEAQLGSFGTITEPWFTDATAKSLLAVEIATYASDKRFPIYTPRSGDPSVPLSTPVGFLLPAAGVLAVLMNRRDSSVADFAPDDFLGANQVALAVGRAALDEMIQRAMNEQFPGVNNGGSEVSTDEGSATLYTLSVTPSDAGTHGQGEGHLWASGTAEVHIDCWPDPDVSFDGPIFLRVLLTETDAECSIEVKPEMGEFDAGQSCCDVFIDILIPVVGIVMLIVIESMIDKVGGELAADFAGRQARHIEAIPPFVTGVAELQACLERLVVSSQGLVFPGKLRIRREGRSFEDLSASGDLPRP